ncbi:MAG: TorF family putative porin, partial [Thiogranum sp.]
MTVTKTLLATALLAGAGVAQAELSANLGVQSNYYFRGITQTDDNAAVSGGIDYAHDSGFYVGTWLSNVDFGGKEDVEVDGYAGFGNDIG